jgi:hypothetical protein
VVVILVIALIILFNLERLSKFIARKEISSDCCLFYNNEHDLMNFPEGYLPQVFAKQLFETCKRNCSDQEKYELDLLKRSREVIEFLVLIWLNRTTKYSCNIGIAGRGRAERQPVEDRLTAEAGGYTTGRTYVPEFGTRTKIEVIVSNRGNSIRFIGKNND